MLLMNKESKFSVFMTSKIFGNNNIMEFYKSWLPILTILIYILSCINYKYYIYSINMNIINIIILLIEI